MYANFGMAIQIKHLSLTPELAENIVGSVTADRIVIVCKASEKPVIVSLLTQIGWKARIQSIVTEKELQDWYERGLRGKFGEELGERILLTLKKQLIAEFPASNSVDFNQFYEGRHYNLLTDDSWIWHNADRLMNQGTLEEKTDAMIRSKRELARAAF
jgi:hypothetical protein